MRHSSGEPATRVYGPTTWDRRGGTISFNFLHPDGAVVDERFVDIVAAAHSISIRTGCFCNSGAGETAFSISKDTLIGAEFAEGMILDDYIRLVGMPTGGAVRVSLGLATNFADVYRFVDFATEFLDVSEVSADLPPRVRHQVAEDYVEEGMLRVVLAVEHTLERLLRQHEQERSLARSGGHRRRTAVDERLVAEGKSGPREAHPDAALAADDHLLDGAVDHHEARR